MEWDEALAEKADHSGPCCSCVMGLYDIEKSNGAFLGHPAGEPCRKTHHLKGVAARRPSAVELLFVDAILKMAAAGKVVQHG
jgi:hypothetical protein